MDEKSRSYKMVEVTVAMIIFLMLAIPAAVWLKDKISSKVAADQSVAASLKRIADHVVVHSRH